jgi:hypothetical protein
LSQVSFRARIRASEHILEDHRIAATAAAAFDQPGEQVLRATAVVIWRGPHGSLSTWSGRLASGPSIRCFTAPIAIRPRCSAVNPNWRLARVHGRLEAALDRAATILRRRRPTFHALAKALFDAQ